MLVSYTVSWLEIEDKSNVHDEMPLNLQNELVDENIQNLYSNDQASVHS